MEEKQFLTEAFRKAGLELSERKVKQFLCYYERLVEKNKVMNLTAITEYEDVVLKHFLDSGMLWATGVIKKTDEEWFGEFNEEIKRPGVSLIDVGTGAGFPGVPLKVLREDLSLTLLDTLNKRLEFLKETLAAMDIHDVTLRHDRAEDAAKDPALREKFDIATSRAVSGLPVLSEYCLPFVKTGGLMIAYKSGDVDNELLEAENAIRILGGQIEKVLKYIVPGTDLRRSLVFVRKVSETPLKYPRKAGKVEKSPLK